MEVLEVWRVCCWFKASTRLEAQGLGGFYFIRVRGVTRTAYIFHVRMCGGGEPRPKIVVVVVVVVVVVSSSRSAACHPL